MATSQLSTKEVARLLNISEATVKRWAEKGTLQSSKTLGGHRRFSLQAIARLRREQNLGQREMRSGLASGKETTSHQLVESKEFLDVILSGDEVATAAALVNGYLHHHQIELIFDTTVSEAMHAVGELWFKGEINVADEHLATRMVLSGLEKLRAVVVPEDQTGLSAISCGIEGDLHELPVHLVEIILESRGWSVVNLGPNTPLFALSEMVKKKRPDLICIAARSVNDLARAAKEYEQLRKIATKYKAIMIVGGEAFTEPAMRGRFPADLHAVDFKTFSRFIRAYAKRSEPK